MLPVAEFALNASKHVATQHSPAYVVYGREPSLPLDHAVRAVTDCTVEAVAERVSRMHSTVQLVKGALARAANTMATYANRKRRDVEVKVGARAWLSTEHLKLAPGLSRKLAAKWVGPFEVEAAVGPVSFKLKLPERWRVHNVFHASQLKPAFGEDQESGIQQRGEVFRPEADADGEFEVEDILDHRDRRGTREYLLKWKGYNVFESSWEPAHHLNCPVIL